MELNRDSIIKALECCSPSGKHCTECVYFYRAVDDICVPYLMADALTLITSQEQRIKELTDENERLKNICESYMLQYGTATDKEAFLKGERADTVRKMHSLIKERCIKGGIYPAFVASTIEKVAKELLGGD